MRPALEVTLILLSVALILSASMLYGGAPSSDGSWSGSRITFSDVPTGTTSSVPDLMLHGNEATDVVVLDASLWLMFRASDRSMLARYQPKVDSATWNISFEAYAPRTGSSYGSVEPGRFGLQAILSGEGESRLGVELCVGNPYEEGVFLIKGGTRQLIDEGILPAYPSGNASDGGRPDRYVVSFESRSSVVRVMVRHTSAGILLNRLVKLTVNSPAIELYVNSDIEPEAAYNFQTVSGGWMVDDLTIRPFGSSYPTIPQAWCTVDQGDPVAVNLLDAEGRTIDANVSISGHVAHRDGDLYQASYDRTVDWSVPTDVEVSGGPVNFKERLLVSTTSSAPGAEVARWWNGWDWASVLGTDDCSGFSTVAAVYRGFSHPLTAYVESTAGNSNDILASQSELAMHYPHDYLDWKRKNWSEAVASAELEHKRLESKYAFASRWDDPAYVGNGDTYISLANPGNAATYQIMFAQYMRGTRIEGTSSNQGDLVAGNFSLYGSWWLIDEPWWDLTDRSWQPARPMDMMDAERQFRTDDNFAPWAEVQEIAARGGLLRVYNHEGNDPMTTEARRLVSWIVDPKDDFGFENWKTTDGEAASYVYAMHTTSVRLNSSLEMGYDVSRKDPKAAGYWLVPVTISIDLGGRQVLSVEVVERSSHGNLSMELQPLEGKRVMDLGYDVREGKLYVSHFFNASATIVVNLSPVDVANCPADKDSSDGSLQLAGPNEADQAGELSADPGLAQSRCAMEDELLAFPRRYS
jgi:hypothetical protein